jgi:hypothetical protein
MDLSVVISTLMRLPEEKMTLIKKDFGKKGLGVEDFVATLMRHMRPRTRGASRSMREMEEVEGIELVSDFTDFFAQVRSPYGSAGDALPNSSIMKTPSC